MTVTDQKRIWEYFQNEAPESFALSRPRMAWLAKRAASLHPRGRVLDVGVGAGTFEEEARAAGLEIHCLDPNERSIETLRAKYELGDRARVGTADAMPFDDASVDVVVLTEVLEHLPDEVLAGTLDEVRRVLVPGGHFLGTVPARENMNASDVVCPGCGLHFHRWGHVRRFEEDDVRRTLAGHFSVESIEECSFPAEPPRASFFGNVKRVTRLALVRIGILGVAPDSLRFAFQARRSEGGA